MTATPTLDRERAVAWYLRNRERSERIFGLVAEDAFERRPIPLRHPFVFYEGHLPAFSYRTLNEAGLGEPPLDARLERLFERGIDPSSLDAAHRAERSDWPSRAEVRAFGERCDARVLDALRHARLDDPAVPQLRRAQAAHAVLEHEPMHHETLVYLIHQLETGHKHAIAQTHIDRPPPAPQLRDVGAGLATLGADPQSLPFGWDNEFAELVESVPAFAIGEYPVTNGDWEAFVAAGGPRPEFWVERDGAWHLRGVFETFALPRSWPVYVSHAQARAYAAWRGVRLPTEAEFHRAAFGSPAGVERPFPWGDASPGPEHGNFDFARFDPEPVDAHPAGTSAWGVRDLIGNGWEWTATPFAPFPGFEPMASYPVYSTDFFDGAHFVMKGASPVTARELIRRSFRNWFYADYPYMYAKFRIVA